MAVVAFAGISSSRKRLALFRKRYHSPLSYMIIHVSHSILQRRPIGAQVLIGDLQNMGASEAKVETERRKLRLLESVIYRYVPTPFSSTK